MQWKSMFVVTCWRLALSTQINATASFSDEAVNGIINAEIASAGRNNWAVLVCTSRFWFNYRHIANTLSIYHTVKRLGIPDSQIILMLADDVACNPRNIYPGRVFNRPNGLNLYGEDVEVDYRGLEVTAENFLRVLTGRQDSKVPRSKRLISDANSNILVYMSGHGGDEFLKFQDKEEVNSQDIADAIQQMSIQKRYKNVFFMVDTCQAGTLHNRFYSQNVISIGSSKKDENSYSYNSDRESGVSLIDRFTYFTLEYMQGVQHGSNFTLADLFKFYSNRPVMSTVDIRSDLMPLRLDQVPLTQFFGREHDLRLAPAAYPIPPWDIVPTPLNTPQLEMAQSGAGNSNPQAARDDIVLQHNCGNDFAAVCFAMLCLLLVSWQLSKA